MSVLMIFIDGIGIGECDEAKNPFARYPTPFLSHFCDREFASIPHDGVLAKTDPTMGRPGLPQSASGQTALLTGVNAARRLGRHASGFPSPTLRKILLQESIFLQLAKMRRVATFANAFTPEYFARPDRQISATTWAVKASSFPFRMVGEELLKDKAISHDLTNNFLLQRGYDVPLRTPERAADILVQLLTEVDFCLFEFILTDITGHKGKMADARRVVEVLDRFLSTLLDRADLSQNLILLTSDHGNFEDLSVSTHTLHSIPTILWGEGSVDLAAKISRIEDVTPTILSFLAKQG